MAFHMCARNKLLSVNFEMLCRVCVRVCVRACVSACVRACLRASVCVCVCESVYVCVLFVFCFYSSSFLFHRFALR